MSTDTLITERRRDALDDAGTTSESKLTEGDHMPRRRDAVIQPNTQLSDARRGLPSLERPGEAMSRGEVADAVNVALARLYPAQSAAEQCVDWRWVAKLERGEHRWPSKERRAALRLVLGVATDGQIGLYNPRAADRVQASAAADLPGVDGTRDGATRSPEWRPLDGQEEISRRRQRMAACNVDDAKLTYLEEAVIWAINENERRPPAALAPYVRELRQHVDDLLMGRQHPGQRQRLYTAGMYMSGLLGALALDLAMPAAATEYGLEAFELAEAADLPEAQAWARAVQSLIAYYTGRYHDALAFARDGHRRAPHSPQTIRLAVNGEARALARLGDRRGVDDAVGRAFAALDRHTAAAEVSSSLALGAYCPARTAANAATAYLALGCSDQVEQYATQALEAFNRTGLRGPQALSRLDLATAALRRDRPEVEHACSLVVEAVEVTANERFASVQQRAREFVAVATPWAGQRDVITVAELVRSYRPGPRTNLELGRS